MKGLASNNLDYVILCYVQNIAYDVDGDFVLVHTTYLFAALPF